MPEMVRVVHEMTRERSDELTALMHRVGLTTQKDLANHAYTLLEWAVKAIEEGRDVASVDDLAMNINKLRLPIFDHVRGKKN